MKKSIVGCCLCFIISHLLCAQQKEFGWLIGTWQLKDKNVYERWKATDDTSLDGYSFKVKEGDTISMERIRFTYDGHTFHYVPDVAGDQGPVDFKITKYSVDGFVAENPQHDFPKIIRYKFIRENNADIIEASIEGNGKVIPYRFVKMK